MREMVKRVVAFVITVLTGLAVGGGAAYAATGTITVTPPDGTQADQTTTYYLYKVFVASGNGKDGTPGTGIRYNTVNTGDVITDSNGNELLHSKGWAVPDCSKTYGENYSDQSTGHFIVDTTGNVHWGTLKTGAQGQYSTDKKTLTYDENDISDMTSTSDKPLDLPGYAVSAIWNYIHDANDEPIKTARTTGTTPAIFTDVDYGYYYVTTTTGSAVSVTSANPNGNTIDKNETPTLTKKIAAVTKNTADSDNSIRAAGSVTTNGDKAIAELGSTIQYEVIIHFNEGATGVILHDTLDSGLRFSAVAPTVSFASESTETDTSEYYKASYTNGTTGSASSLTIDFSNTPSNIASATVTYTAIVDSDGLTSEEAAKKNEAYLEYGTNPAKAQTSRVSTEVYNATYKVTKTDSSGQALAGAGFLLYYTIGSDTDDTRYYYKKNGNDVTWVKVTPETTNNADGTTSTETYENAARKAAQKDEITELTTTEGTDGNVISFTGLPNGTFYLYELDVPAGYRRASDVTLTIDDATESDAFDAKNLYQEATVQNNTGSELPTTGGIGRTGLYAVGGCLLAGAVALAIVRKRMTAK